MSKILLSTFVIKIKNPSNEYSQLDKFNGIDDFFKFTKDYLDNIFSEIRGAHSASDFSNLYLTLASPAIIDVNKRVIYGLLESGVGGDTYNIKNIASKEKILDVNPDHAAFRNLFFWIKLPKNKQEGALILQRKSKFGVKTIFSTTMNSFMRDLGYERYHIDINNMVHGKVYRKMIEEGKLKRLSFIRKKIPGSIEEYYQNGAKPQEIKGEFTTSISASNLPHNYKEFVNKIFTNPKNERIEIIGSDEKFDELEFELELNGKRKTFYVMNRHRIQPDVDVTSNVEIVDGEATIESLVIQAEELYKDIIDTKPQ